jgi:HAMP domain-containing protein
MNDGAIRSVQRLMLLTGALALCVWLGAVVALLGGAEATLADMRRRTADALARAASQQLERTGTDLSEIQPAISALVAATQGGGWRLAVLDQGGLALAMAPEGASMPLDGIRAVRALSSGPLAGGSVVAAAHASATGQDLAAVLEGVVAGLVVGLWLTLEIISWRAERGLLGPIRELSRLANAAHGGDFRYIPTRGGMGEVGTLAAAVARFVSFLTLRRREVDLLLNDARKDTFDPELVERAGAHIRRLDEAARVSADDPLPVISDGNPGLKRMLCSLTSFLFTLWASAVADPKILLSAIGASALCGWLVLPAVRLLGRRPLAALSGAAGFGAALTLPPELAVVLCAAASVLVVRCVTAAAGEPSGAEGARRAAGLATGVATGVMGAAALLLVGDATLGVVNDTLMPLGVALLTLWAVAACDDRLEAPHFSNPVPLGEVLQALSLHRLGVTLLGLLLPAAAVAGGAMLAVIHPTSSPGSVLAAGAGWWIAAPLAAIAVRRRALLLGAQALAVLVLGAATLVPLPQPGLGVVIVVGIASGLLWHMSVRDLHQSARQFRTVIAEQVTVRMGSGVLVAGLALPAAAAMSSGGVTLAPLLAGAAALGIVVHIGVRLVSGVRTGS